jgi:geranylgeranyl pyrophosphate synthase
LHICAGLPVALNAGNWLYFAALEALGEIPLEDARAALVLRRAHAFLARCHEGQALDVGVSIDDVPQDEVPALVRAISEGKTGGLAALAASLSATCAGASRHAQAAFAAFGNALGVGLQMLDDLGAILSDARAEKGQEDLRNRRVTWAWARLAQDLDPESYRDLLRDPDLPRMRRLLGDGARQLAHREMQGALAILRDAGSSPRALGHAAALIAAIGKSYG